MVVEKDQLYCLGAIYLDGGIEEVRKLLKVVVFPHVLAVNEVQFVDYKSRLQEYIQAETRSALEYRLDNVQGLPHMRVFTMSVYLDGLKLGTGVGKTKKDATQ